MSQKSSNPNDSFKSGATSKLYSATAFDSADTANLDTSAFQTRAYHELLDNPHIELDGLQRLQENLTRLEDLHGRLQFLMRDLSSLLKK
jgi:hypothetical protein